MGSVEAVRFLTVLPVPSRQATSEGIPDSLMAHPIVCFPLVGAPLGVMLALLDWGLHRVVPSQVSAAMVLVTWIALTGGLHLDGLADTADGLLGGAGIESSDWRS